MLEKQPSLCALWSGSLSRLTASGHFWVTPQPVPQEKLLRESRKGRWLDFLRKGLSTRCDFNLHIPSSASLAPHLSECSSFPGLASSLKSSPPGPPSWVLVPSASVFSPTSLVEGVHGFSVPPPESKCLRILKTV